MNKLNEADGSSSPTDVEIPEKREEKGSENDEPKETPNEDNSSEIAKEKVPSDEQDVIKFTMLYNKFNSVLDAKKRNDETKYSIFFNKEVTIRRPEGPVKFLEPKMPVFLSPRRNQPMRPKSKVHSHTIPMAEPQISEPGMMFCSSLFSSLPNICERKTQSKPEIIKKPQSKRGSRVEDPLVQLNVRPATKQTDLRNHNSLTNLIKTNNKSNGKGSLKSKIPSLTALDTNAGQPKSGPSRFGFWDHWDDLILMQSDVEKRLNLQISRSSNDNNRRSLLKFKKEDAASVSDSKLLYADSESKKHIKKCDKKSRGDSSRKERGCGSRKQVQWKTEVDVIYFSTHMAANGDRTGEVIGRVMEPLREEWEQQRKGFYAKMATSHMESHIKDHFISLLKI